MKQETTTRELSIPRVRIVLVGYGICILLAVMGVILGAINFAAGPVHYPGFVLVLWLLANIFLFAVVVVHMIYYLVELGRCDNIGPAILIGMLLCVPLVLVGIASLVVRHYGWFSIGSLAALVLCIVINVFVFL